MEEQKSYTIIGWGLAGATLAWQLHFRRISFKIYDSGKNDSTRTAAGLVNPIVFKRLTKSWMADLLLPYAAEFYHRIEQELDDQLVSNRDILRIFASVEEQNNWASREGDDRFHHFLDPIQDVKLEKIDAPFGGGKVKTIGNLNTNLYLDASKEYLQSKGIDFVETPFDYYDINETDQFVFCEGYEIRNNFFFNYLPMKPTHGETLTITTEEIQFEDIINKNMFVLPIGKGQYKIGATYNWDLTESEITPFGKTELIEKLKTFANFEYEIIDHQAGIRPTVSDRRPLIGTHPKHQNLHVLNGLGTKGVMIAPFFSEQLLNHLVNNKELNPEVDIKRYEKHFNA